VELAREAVRTMFVSKVKIAGAVLLATAMLGTGATLLLRAAPQAEPPARIVEQRPARPLPNQAAVQGEKLPSGALARMGTMQLRHADAVSFAAYTPDGNSLVTAGRDQMVRLWDVATGKELRRFEW